MSAALTVAAARAAGARERMERMRNFMIMVWWLFRRKMEDRKVIR
jgi:hypothetical protein